MEIQVLDQLSQKPVYSSSLPVETQRIVELQHTYPDSSTGSIAVLGRCFNGVQLVLIEIQPLKSAVVKIDTHIHAYQMLFMLEGDAHIRFEGNVNADCKLRSGEHCLQCLKPCCLLFDIHHAAKFLFICLKESNLDWIDPSDLHLNRCMSISTNIKSVIASIISCQQVCGIKWVFLESKILELIFLQLDQTHAPQENGISHSVKEYDVEKIELAKSLVEQNMQNPCSLIELAHQVGLNDFKLKKGFKELFGNTVFGYLHDLRMERARNMLLENKKVSDVAYEVGYKNAQHFAAAFKKHFGVLPSQLK